MEFERGCRSAERPLTPQPSCCQPAGTHPAQGAFMCAREERRAKALSRNCSPALPSPSNLFTSELAYFTWVRKLVIGSDSRMLYHNFQGQEMLMLSCQVESLPKWFKIMQKFAHCSKMDEMWRTRILGGGSRWNHWTSLIVSVTFLLHNLIKVSESLSICIVIVYECLYSSNYN